MQSPPFPTPFKCLDSVEKCALIPFSREKKSKENRRSLEDYIGPEAVKGQLNEGHLFYMAVH